MNQTTYSICICGGGNLGHTIAGYISSKSRYNVKLLTSHPEKWTKEFKVRDSNGRVFNGKLSAISDHPADVLPDSDFILLCLPGYAIEKELKQISPYLQAGMKVGSVVSSTGFFFLAKQLLPRTTALFGFHRVPFISRIDSYGHSACLLGYKKQLKIAVVNDAYPEKTAGIWAEMLDTPVAIAGHFMEVALSNSNPLLHTSRLYNLFRNYREGIFYDKNILFYEEWSDEDSALLLACDNEFFGMIGKLPVDPRAIEPILTYYECRDIPSLTRKIRSIEAFKGLKAPMKLSANQQYIPDFSNRYFLEDFNYGLTILKQIGEKIHAEIPHINMIYDWAIRFIPSSQTDFHITF